MDAYLLSRNILAQKRPGAATRIGSIPLPPFSKRKEPLHSPQTTFFRNLAGLHQTSDANGVGLADAQRNVCALHQNATRHGISIVVSPAAVHVSNRSASTYRIVRLPRIGSFGFHVSNRSAQHDRRRPPPSNAGPPPRRCATHQSLTRSAGAAEAGIRDIRGTRTLIPSSSLRLLAPIDATLRQKPPSSTDFPTPYFVEGPTYDAANASSIFTTSRSALEIAVPEVIVKRARQTGTFSGPDNPNAPPIPENATRKKSDPQSWIAPSCRHFQFPFSCECVYHRKNGDCPEIVIHTIVDNSHSEQNYVTMYLWLSF